MVLKVPISSGSQIDDKALAHTGSVSMVDPDDSIEVLDVDGRSCIIRRGDLDWRYQDQTSDGSSTSAITLGPLSIEPLTREVSLEGRSVRLTRREFDLLLFLARHPRQVFSKAALLSSVWSSDASWQSEATVTEHVRRLRQKLGHDKSDNSGLMTVWGVGYRFEP